MLFRLIFLCKIFHYLLLIMLIQRSNIMWAQENNTKIDPQAIWNYLGDSVKLVRGLEERQPGTLKTGFKSG